MDLKEALVLLDPQDDAHWTEDGAPLLGVLDQMLERSVTRKEVIEAAPLFTRANPLLDLIEVEQDENPEIKTAKEEIPELSPEEEEEVPEHIKNVLRIKTYRERNIKEAYARAQRRQKFKELIGEAPMGRAPIDEAMARRRKRGTARPQHPAKTNG